MNKLNTLMSKLKLDKHHKIEQFGVLFICLMLCFAIVIVSCASAKVKASNTAMTEDAVYSTEFVSSRTGTSGDVINVFTSKDKTKTFVLLKFDDITSVSRDAATYQMFLTGATPSGGRSKLKSEPAGSIYFFGSTGYMGVYLINNSGFEKQILDLTVRCNKELTSVDEENITTEYDESFKKFDQFKVYLNPGGTKASSLDCLDSDTTPTAYDLYEQSVVIPQELEIKQILDDDILTLQTDLSLLEDRTNNLVRQGVHVPELPAVVSGDVVLTETEEDNTVRTFKPSTVIAKGYDFDWHAGSVHSGYSNVIDTNGLTIAQYLDKKNMESDKGFTVKDLGDWYMNDGTLVDDMNSGSSSARYNQIVNDISLYEDILTTYYKDKQKYQVEDLRNLLLLEVDSHSVESDCTVNVSENVLQCY